MSRRSRPWPPGTPCWTDLATPDPASVHAFYRAVLGWDIEVGPPEFGGYSRATRDGGAVAGIGPTMSPDAPTGWSLYFATDDAKASAQAATRAGGTVVVEPVTIPGTGTMALVADPSGATSGLWEAGPFIGAETVNEPGGIVWEDLRSADPAASRAFLSAVFGIEHDPLPGMEDQDYTTMRLGEPFPLGGVGPLWDAPTPGWIVYFGVEDVDAAVKVAREHGAQHVGEVNDTPYGRMATVSDPSGAHFILSQNTGQPQPDRA